jgi:hypothetical protein
VILNARTHSTAHRRRGIVAAVAVGAIVALALAATHYYTRPAHIAKVLTAAIAPDGSYRVAIGGSKYQPFRRRIVVTDVMIAPDTLFLARDSLRTQCFFRASSLHIDGLPLVSLNGGDIEIASIQVDAPRLEILVDRTLPSPGRKIPVTLPHQKLKQVDRSIRVDEIHIVDGEVVYAERAVDGSRPGKFVFADIAATVANVTNDAKRMEKPCTIDLQTRLADSGLMNATFQYGFAPRGLSMDYHATVGQMDALSLNDLLIDLVGIRVETGSIDTTSFHFKVDHDVAMGKVRVVYTDVDFAIVSKDSGEQSFKDAIATWMSDHRESNPAEDDEAALVMVVRREREPHVGVTKFVWETVREGLLRTLDLQ